MNTQQQEVREDIITLFNIKDLPEDKQEETINRIGTIIFQNVLMRTLPMLNEEDLAKYEELLEKNSSPEDLMDFFGDRIPTFLEIVKEESISFREKAGELFKK
ncbi:MAG: hypothetical protein KBD14_00105 [Candidatus Pacebacteria bacterium]|jgi:hypothetical protein|nr:hypothetical protein [Candidatus Paceibacterota bacterium]